jgi:Tfp pilus assembly protein PilF
MDEISRGKQLFFFLIPFIVLFSSAVGQENTANYWMERADGYFNRGSAELAIKCYDKVLEHDSMNESV